MMYAVKFPNTSIALGIAISLHLCVFQVPALATVVFSDGFSVSADSFNVNFETASRQSGALAPLNYLASTVDSTNDYHHQLFSAGTIPSQPLQLAGDGFLPLAPPPVFVNPAMVSPNYNFVGNVPGSGIVGKRITFDVDIAVLIQDPTGGTFVTGGVSIGANAPLTIEDSAVPQFGVKFVEDGLPGGLGPFLQFFDSGSLVQNVVPHVAGNGTLSVQLDIDDLVDGNPWDGIGSTTISVSVNGVPAGTPHTIGGGGLTSNYITLLGYRDFNGNDLATHFFDNLAVHALPIPEPTCLVLVLGVACGLFCKRHNC